MEGKFGIQINQRTVNRIINQHKDSRTVKRKQGSGRPRKTSAKTDHVLKRLAMKRRKQSLTQLVNSFCETTGVKLCKNTIKSHLEEVNISSYAYGRKPLLPMVNRKKQKIGQKCILYIYVFCIQNSRMNSVIRWYDSIDTYIKTIHIQVH